MSKKLGKYKLGRYEHQKYLQDDGNVSLDSTHTVDAQALNGTGLISSSVGFLNTKLTIMEGGTDTGVSDKTNIVGDHKIFVTGRLSQSIKLPQATATNAGDKIEVLVADGGIISASIGVSSTGTTRLSSGKVTVHSTNAKFQSLNFATDTSTQINLSEAVSMAGGKEGSVYRFYYQEKDKIHVEANGLLGADGTIGLTSNISSSAAGGGFQEL
tara:strand:- start:364 stop:1002 length:639 start_codon:yes stop_codon:yes gene_type:complete